MRSKKLDKKNDRYQVIIDHFIDDWRKKRQIKTLYLFWRNWASTKAREHRQIDYCDDFFH